MWFVSLSSLILKVSYIKRVWLMLLRLSQLMLAYVESFYWRLLKKFCLFREGKLQAFHDYSLFSAQRRFTRVFPLICRSVINSQYLLTMFMRFSRGKGLKFFLINFFAFFQVIFSALFFKNNDFS